MKINATFINHKVSRRTFQIFSHDFYVVTGNGFSKEIIIKRNDWLIKQKK